MAVLTDEEFREIQGRDATSRQEPQSFAERMADACMPVYAKQAVEDRTRLLREVEALRKRLRTLERRPSSPTVEAVKAGTGDG